MTLEESSNIVKLYAIAGVKFEGDIKEINYLWYECLKDLEYNFVVSATKEVIKSETDLFPNGLIAKTRQKAKFIRDMFLIEKANKQLEGKDDIRRIGRGNK